MRLYGEAAEDYRVGRFEQAAARLREAYGLYAEPVLLYNLARALEGSGALHDAQETYRRYLSVAPEDAEERQSAEARLVVIAELIGRLEPGDAAPEADEAEASTEVSSEPEPAAEPRGVGGLIGGVTLSVLGAIGLGVGVGLGVHAVSMAARASARSHLDAQTLHVDAGTFATAANISFVLAGTIGLVGLTWTLIELISDGGSSSRPALRTTLRLGGIELSGRF